MDFSAKFDRRAGADVTLDAEALRAVAEEIYGGALRRAAPLSGGYANTNLLLEYADGERAVLRVARDPERLAVEADLLDLLPRAAPELPVPRVIWRAGAPMAGGIGGFAMSYVDGEPLARLEDELSAAACRDLCEQIAVAAAQIHAVTFARRGLFGPGLTLTPFEEDGRPGFLESCLENADLHRRVGPERFVQLRQCVFAHAALGRPHGAPQFCHSDFNLKNLLGAPLPNGKVKLSAVLDWEFAFVNAAENDIGNLLRFEDESPSIDAAWFASAYVGAGAHLERDWRERSLYADLSAQTSFLISREELPRTFATAISVIDRTLARLAPWSGT